MSQADSRNTTTPSRFHNVSDAMLADKLGHADALLKGAEAECKALKDEFKRRGLLNVAGDEFTVTATEQISGRLDTKAVREFLGESLSPFRECGGLDRDPHQGRRAVRRCGVAPSPLNRAACAVRAAPLSTIHSTELARRPIWGLPK